MSRQENTTSTLTTSPTTAQPTTPQRALEATVDGARLHTALRILDRTAASSRQACMPEATKCVHVSTRSGRVRLAATDLATWVTLLVPTLDDPAVGTATALVDSKRLLKAATSTKGGPTELALPDHGARLEVRGDGMKLRLGSSPGDDGPAWPSFGTESHPVLQRLVVRTEELREALRCALTIDTEDDARPHLAHVLFSGEGDTVAVVTTDGHRAQRSHVTGRLERLTPGQAPEVVDVRDSDIDDWEVRGARHGVGGMHLRLDAARRLLDVLESGIGDEVGDPSVVTLEATENHVRAHRGGAGVLGSTADAAHYPNYAEVMKLRSTAEWCSFPKKEVRDAIRRLKPHMPDNKTTVLSWRYDDSALAMRLVLTVTTSDGDEASTDVPCTINPSTTVADWRSRRIGINALYLDDAMQWAAADDVVMFVDGALDPVHFYNGLEAEDRHVVMPVRI